MESLLVTKKYLFMGLIAVVITTFLAMLPVACSYESTCLKAEPEQICKMATLAKQAIPWINSKYTKESW